MDNEDQENECLALESILESNFNYVNGIGKICIDVNLPQNKLEVFKAQQLASSSNDSDDRQNLATSLEYLPPINLEFIFNKDYPSLKAPTFTLSCVWLQQYQLQELQMEMMKIWEKNKGMEILYTWYDFLQNEALQVLKIENKLVLPDTFESKEGYEKQKFSSAPDIKKTNIKVKESFNVFKFLYTYNEEQKQKIFNDQIFDCLICFSKVSGLQCIKLIGCEHIFCKGCVTSYLKSKLGDGPTIGIKCLDSDCDSMIHNNQIKQLVDKQTFENYEERQLTIGLDMMKDIVYCPLKFCQSAVIVEEGSDLAQCQVCKFSFCAKCYCTYHSPNPCVVSSDKLQSVVKEFEEGDDKIKEYLIMKYSEKTIKEWKIAFETQEADEKYLKENSVSCPNCGIPIIKTGGCHHMCCLKCDCHFCWTCGQVLRSSDPYRHYREPSSPCFNQLFNAEENFENLIF